MTEIKADGSVSPSSDEVLSELLGRKNWFAITKQAVGLARELGLDDGDAKSFAFFRRAEWCHGKRNNDGAYPLATARDVVKWKGDHEALMGRVALDDEKERQRALQLDAELQETCSSMKMI